MIWEIFRRDRAGQPFELAGSVEAPDAEFAETCEASNIAFIGPTAQQIRVMGDKAAARNAMTKVGVPVIPGTPGPVEDADEALRFAREIGFPVIIKAAAGGGGKGMRVAPEPEEAEVEGEAEAECQGIPLAEQDQILLCSDGLTEMANDTLIGDVLRAAATADDACRALVELALGRGGKDNVTVIVARYRFAQEA